MNFGIDLLSREMQSIAQYAAKHGTETVLYHNVFLRWAAGYDKDEALADRVRQAWAQLPRLEDSWQLFKARFPKPFVQFVEKSLRDKQ
jgi:hypothetical protein